MRITTRIFAADRREYADCPRRVNGYCSPCKLDCKFHRYGRCEYHG